MLKLILLAILPVASVCEFEYYDITHSHIDPKGPVKEIILINPGKGTCIVVHGFKRLVYCP